jgi:hypothetical protein
MTVTAVVDITAMAGMVMVSAVVMFVGKYVLYVLILLLTVVVLGGSATVLPTSRNKVVL